MARTALIAGATGLVGRALLEQLLANDAYSAVKIVGRALPAVQSKKSLQFIASDFSDLGTHAAALAADDVFCCLGTTLRKAGSQAAFEKVDYHMVVDLARAAKQAGAKQFLVVSAAGSSVRSPSFYSRVKARMEQAVSEVGFATTHILRPSLLLGVRDEFRPAERVGQLAAPILKRVMLGPLKKYRPVSATTVATAMIALAQRSASGSHIHHLPLES